MESLTESLFSIISATYSILYDNTCRITVRGRRRRRRRGRQRRPHHMSKKSRTTKMIIYCCFLNIISPTYLYLSLLTPFTVLRIVLDNSCTHYSIWHYSILYLSTSVHDDNDDALTTLVKRRATKVTFLFFFQKKRAHLISLYFSVRVASTISAIFYTTDVDSPRVYAQHNTFIACFL